MEKKIKNACCICKNSLADDDGVNIYEEITKYSKSPIINILKNIQEVKLLKSSEYKSGCRSCIIKLNNYDHAIETANEIRREIIQLIEKSNQVLQFQLLPSLQLSTQIDKRVDLESNSDYIKEHKFDCSEYKNNIHEFEQTQLLKHSTLNHNHTSNKACNQVFQNVNIKLRIKNMKYECSECDMKFSKKYALQCHQQNHTKKNCSTITEDFKCEHCDFIGKSQSILNGHKKNLHGNLKPFKCNLCEKRFVQSSSLNRHLPAHTGEKRFQCEKCGKKFGEYSSFRMHKLAHDNIREKECTICGLKFSSTSHLKRHSMVHSGEKPHKCSNCGGINIYQEVTKYSKSLLINVLNNIQKIEVENIDIASGCKNCISKLNKYDRAIVTANRIRQEILELIEKSKEIFRNKLPDILHTTKPDFIASVSNEIDLTLLSDTFKLEIKTRDNIKPQTRDNIKLKLETESKLHFKSDCVNKNTKETIFINSDIIQHNHVRDKDEMKHISTSTRLPICKVCNKAFEKVSELNEHRQTKEHLDAHNKNAKFECGECGKKFTKKYALECHLPIHIGEHEEYTAAPIDNNEYICENCDFKTNSHTLLNRHKQIHSNLKPFKCPFCDKRFAQSSSINRHLPVHTGEKRFQCDTCGRQFNAHSSFQRHKSIHENKGEKHHECPICGRKYAHRYNMDSHIKKKHSNVDRKKKCFKFKR